MQDRANLNPGAPEGEAAAPCGQAGGGQAGGGQGGPGDGQPAGGGESREGSGTAADEVPRTLPEAVALIARLRADLAAKDTEAKESYDRFLRERAEAENFKRRMQREKAEALRYANEPLLRELLAVIDNLERAVRAAGNADEGAPGGASRGGATALPALVTGVEMVLRQFAEVLGRFGVSRIAAAEQSFDPAHHEALAHVETDAHQPGTVLLEHLSGYRLHDRLLRAAQVTVAKAPDQPRGDGSGDASTGGSGGRGGN